MLPITVTESKTKKAKPGQDDKIGFGTVFTDHMFLCNYTEGKGWHDARITPYQPFELDPGTAVFHYSQSIFEGLKCYRRSDGGLNLFRAKDNFARMNRSAARLGMPKLDTETFLQGLIELLKIDCDWVPKERGKSLYIRPTLMATDINLSVYASKTYLFYIILSPVGAYYPGGLAANDIYVEDKYVRAVRGGIGETKAGANYAASLLAGVDAANKGFAQVLWLDGVEQRYIEEVGAMNIFFVNKNGVVVTPELTGSILPGITRDSVLRLAKSFGYETKEKRLPIEDVITCLENKTIAEAFGSGTAAVISPVKSFQYKGQNIPVGDSKIGPVAQKLYDELTGIQYGERPDPFDWIINVQ